MPATSTRTRDQRLTGAIIRMNSGLGRRAFLGKAAAVATTAFATTVFGPLGERREALASTTPACSPPFGRYCSGCSSAGDCPATHINCTTSTPYSTTLCCPHAIGYWYAPTSPVGDRHKCRDCRVATCPCCCTSTCQSGFCGCRSTIHY